MVKEGQQTDSPGAALIGQEREAGRCSGKPPSTVDVHSGSGFP